MDRARTGIKNSDTKNPGEGKPSLYASIRNFILPFLGGFFMGIANLIPGVSGGTVALMIGIFEKLVNSLANLSFKNVLSLLSGGSFIEKIKRYGFDFLMFLAVGALFSIVFGSKPVSFLLENYPILTMIFFSGLIIGSLPIIFSDVTKKSKLLYAFLGFVFVLIMKLLENNYQNVESSNSNLLFLALSGALAMCAMVLPGVSGAFVLVLFGQYERVINAINNFEYKILIIFGAGALVGIVLFSKILKFVFLKYKDAILSFFIGTMIAAAIFLPEGGILIFLASYKNFSIFSLGFLISLIFSIYELKKKHTKVGGD